MTEPINHDESYSRSVEAGAPGADEDPGYQWIRSRARSLEAAAIAGVAYAVLALSGLWLLSRFPKLSLTDDELTAWFDESDHQAALILGLNLVTLSSIAFLWFVAVIRRRLGDREDRFFATVFFGSGVLYVAIALVAAAVLAAPAVAMTLLDAGTVDPASASLAAGVGASLLLVVAPRVQAVFILTTSTVILRSRMLPRWLAIVGYVTAVFMFIIPLVTRPTVVAFPIWVFIVSIVVLLNRPTDTTAGARFDDATSTGGAPQT